MGKRETNGWLIRKIALGVGTAITSVLALTAICTSMILGRRVEEGSTGLLVFTLLAIASFVGGCMSTRGKEKGSLMPPAVGGVLLVILLVTGLLLIEGEIIGFWRNTGAVGLGVLITYLVILLKTRKRSLHSLMKFRAR